MGELSVAKATEGRRRNGTAFNAEDAEDARHGG